MQNEPTNSNIFLAILPLQVLSSDPKAEMFCQGLVMDLISDLSRFRSFQIIAFETIQGLQPDLQHDSPLLDALQLDYLVKGMARLQKEKLVINLQLINVPQNRVVWGERFSGGFDDLFHIQEEIVEKIVVALQHFVDYDLLREIRKKPLTTLNAYECWLKGYRELWQGTLEADERARTYFQQAMALDPHYPRAYTGMSLSYFNEWSCQLWSRWEVSQNGAFEWAQKALALDEWDHVSNAILGRIYLFSGEYEKAEHFLRKALRINPNDADTLVLIAFGFVYLGYPEEAKRLYERARRLNPADTIGPAACGAFINFELGNVDEAISLAKHYQLDNAFVDFAAFQAAAYFTKGELEKMRACWDHFLAEFSRKINGGKPADSQTALRWMINVNPYRRGTQLRPFWEYMSGNAPAPAPDVSVAPAPVTLRQGRFALENGLWMVTFAGQHVQLPDLKGCHDLARLLAHPNHPIHCTELMAARVLERGQAVFDEKAKAAYQQRILELQAGIDEAEAVQDTDRLVALQEEYDELLDYLSQVTGKGGRARKVAGSIEKCRSAVTWRIRNAIRKIAEAHPALGKHLEVSVRTGVFCEYAPEHEMEWVL